MSLAKRLRSDGVDVVLDQWHLALGDQLPQFMETSVRESQYVILVCTPTFRTKADGRKGGVGYEGHIITAEMLRGVQQRKFVPVLREGEWDAAAPSWLGGKLAVDLRGDPFHEVEYARLLEHLHDDRTGPPPLGRYRRTNPTRIRKDEGSGQEASHVSDSQTGEDVAAIPAPSAGSPRRDFTVVDTEARASGVGASTNRRDRENDLPVRHSNLPPRCFSFVGQDRAFKEIGDALDTQTARRSGPGMPAALVGIGGVGKSSVAAEFAYRTDSRFRKICWVDGSSTRIRYSLAALAADPLNLGLDGNIAIDAQLTAVRATLEQDGPNLLILDNIDHPSLYRTYLPTSAACAVLITTRRQDLLDTYSIPIRPLDEDESLELLLPTPESDAEVRRTASDLARLLGYLPLALAIARCQCASGIRSLRSILSSVRAEGPLPLADTRRVREAFPDRLPLRRLFDSSVDLLLPADSHDRAARLLFAAAGWLAPTPIPRTLFGRLLADVAREDDGILAAALERLYDVGLLAPETSLGRHHGAVPGTMTLLPGLDQPIPAFHRVIVAYAHDWSPTDTSRAVIQAIAAQALSVAPQGDRLITLGPLVPHMAHALDWPMVASVPDEEGLVAVRLMEYYQTRADYPASASVAERALARHPESEWSRRLGQALRGFQTLFGMGSAESVAVAEDGVEDPEREAMALLAAGHLEAALRILTTLLANLCASADDELDVGASLKAREADEATRRAPERRIVAEMIRQRRVISVTLGLARLTLSSGAIDTGLQYVDQLKPVVQSMYGGDSLEFANVLQLEGEGLHCSERTVEALQSLRRALQIRERTLGDKHLDVSVTRGAIATALWSIGRGSGALALLDRAISDVSENAGWAHAQLAALLHARGRIHVSGGSIDEAEADLSAAVASLERAGEGVRAMKFHVDIELALLRVTVGRPGAHRRAEALLLQAENLLGTNHGLVVQLRDALHRRRFTVFEN